MDSSDSGLIVVKQLQSFADVTPQRQALRREGRRQQEAQGPGVVPILGGGIAATLEGRLIPNESEWNQLRRPFIVGQTLGEILSNHAEPDTPDGITIAVSIAFTLARLHTELRMFHRDVTPGNILVAKDGAIYLNDFGLARSPSDPALIDSELLQGTRAFLPPEVFSGLCPGPPSDVYQLALSVAASEFTNVRKAWLTQPAPQKSHHGHAEQLHQAARSELQAAQKKEATAGKGSRMTVLCRQTLLACLDERPNARPSAQELGACLRALPDPC